MINRNIYVYHTIHPNTHPSIFTHLGELNYINWPNSNECGAQPLNETTLKNEQPHTSCIVKLSLVLYNLAKYCTRFVFMRFFPRFSWIYEIRCTRINREFLLIVDSV